MLDCESESELGTCGYKSFTGCVVFKLLEVVDEHFGKFGSFFFPNLGVGVSVAGIEDFGIYAGKFGRNFEVEDGELLGGSSQDSTVKDSVDDATGIADRDTFASTVPAGVYEVCFSSALFHFLHEFFSVFGRVEFEERLAEAS